MRKIIMLLIATAILAITVTPVMAADARMEVGIGANLCASPTAVQSLDSDISHTVCRRVVRCRWVPKRYCRIEWDEGARRYVERCATRWVKECRTHWVCSHSHPH